MTRSRRRHNHSPYAPKVGAKRRNVAAILISAAAVGFLYLNFDPTPAGGGIGDDTVDVDAITREIDLPTTAVATDASGKPAAPAGNSLTGKTALLMNVMLLERGMKKLEKVGSYTATFYKRELVDGAMMDGQVMKLKVRHKPFSIYMKWIVGDAGRELLYVDGQNDGNMVVKLGGIKGRLIPAVKLDPTGDTAMKEARHPVTEIGLVNLAKQIIDYRRKDMRRKTGVTCRMFDNQTVNGSRCFCFIIEYESAEVSKIYRKSVIFVEKETCLPICVKNFTWPEAGKGNAPEKKLDKRTLIEDYRYSDVRLDELLADGDFDRNNAKYRLRR